MNKTEKTSMARIVRAGAIGIIAYSSFEILPYFPVAIALCFALLLSVIGYKFIRIAIFMTMTVSTVVLSYHSPQLGILYMIAVLIFVLVTVWSPSFPDTFLMVAGAPVLATLAVFKFSVPLEFLLIFLAPLLLKGKKAPVIAGLACLWCCIYGIVGRYEIMGYLLIGKPMHWFYHANPGPTFFYDLGWLEARFSDGIVTLGHLGGILKNIGQFFVAHPVVLLQPVFWAGTSYFIRSFIKRKRWWFDSIGIVGGAVMIVLLQLVAAVLHSGRVTSNVGGFLISVGIVTIAVLGVLEFEYLRARGERSATPRPRKKPIQQRRRSPGLSASSAKETKTVKPENLSLEDWLKIQRDASDQIRERFTQTVTAMDIDLADSTRLKHGEKDEDIAFSFSRYWEFVDKVVERNDGKLISRAGDGAMYVFKRETEALQASRSILQRLGRFNKSKNRLQSPFSLRIGLNTGNIIRDESEPSGEVFSRVLDIAGHLQKMASPGQILVSENTYKRLKDKSRLEKSDYLTRDDIDVYRLK